MDLRPHRLPDDVLSRLGAGGGGGRAMRALTAAEESKHRLLVFAVADLAPSEPVRRAFDVLTRVEKSHREVVRDVLRHPAVGAWAKRTVHELQRGRDGGPRGSAQLGAVAAVAAARAGVECRIEVPAWRGTVMLPSLGQISLREPVSGPVELRVRAGGTAEAAGLSFTAAPAVVNGRGDAEGGPPPAGWEPLHRISVAGPSLLVDDLDPFRWDPATATDDRLAPAELRHWRDCHAAAWDLLTAHHWTIAEEVAAAVSVLTPIKGPEHGQNSASARDRFGTVAMSTPPDGRWLASTYAHEVQHAKLGAVLDVVELVRPDARRYYAPWRDDPRPLPGLLQGAYAYLGVAGFWRRQREYDPDRRPHIEFARWRRSAFEVTGTLLASGALTGPGEEFVTRMRGTLSAWQDEPVPASLRAAAREEADAHHRAWVARNGLTG
ncbi:HEXXH motif domain-containing protein [Nonomuraea jiangxiensis]|uniref:HEXXH motif-containing protein n=1 Tax=Nonomuraea jiangxiensis TaxID=633440 RepID=A0A1G9FAA8_9ACTN|nr:HEXXH motif domain-containing protein [Nonomuraea jiangxiensis]SDK85310.1 HEXXH motif-containing protein [Nonomuraea jiangxiensis]